MSSQELIIGGEYAGRRGQSGQRARREPFRAADLHHFVELELSEGFPWRSSSLDRSRTGPGPGMYIGRVNEKKEE